MFLMVASFICLIVLTFSLLKDNWAAAIVFALMVVILEIIITKMKEKNHIREIEDWDD